MFYKYSLYSYLDKVFIAGLMLWFLLLSTTFFFPASLDNWNLINNSLRFNNFETYFDTTGVGFSSELIYYYTSLLFGPGISYLIISFSLFLLFCYLVYKIYFFYSQDFRKSLLLVFLSLPFALPQMGGWYWDQAGLYLALLVIFIIDKKLTLPKLTLVAFLASILFFGKQNSGITYLFIIAFSAILTGKRFLIKDLIYFIFIFCSALFLLHLITFKNFDIFPTLLLHFQTMFNYLGENSLDSGNIKLNELVFKIFPVFQKSFFNSFYPLATPYNFLITFMNLFIIFKLLRSIILRDRKDPFLYFSILGIHFISIIFWGRNWSNVQSLLPLVFFLSFTPKLSIKKLIPIFLIFIIFSFIVCRALYISVKYDYSSPIKPLYYSHEVIMGVEKNLNSKFNFLSFEKYIKKINPECIFAIGYASYPFLAYGEEMCTDRVQISQSKAVLDESTEAITKSFIEAVKAKKRIMVLDGCFMTNKEGCREKGSLFYTELETIFSTNLLYKESHGSFVIYHNIENN